MKFIALAFVLLACSSSLRGEEPTVNRLFAAKAAFEYKGQLPADPEKVFTANLPRGEESAEVHQIPKTAVFEVSVSASSPEAAAMRANQIVLSFRDLLGDPNSSIRPIVILNSAHASETRPLNSRP